VYLHSAVRTYHSCGPFIMSTIAYIYRALLLMYCTVHEKKKRHKMFAQNMGGPVYCTITTNCSQGMTYDTVKVYLPIRWVF